MGTDGYIFYGESDRFTFTRFQRQCFRFNQLARRNKMPPFLHPTEKPAFLMTANLPIFPIEKNDANACITRVIYETFAAVLGSTEQTVN